MNRSYPSLEDLQNIAVDAALLAVNVIMSALGSGVRQEHKGKTDLVTQVDRTAENVIINKIHEHFPDHQILAEESGKNNTDSPILWVIDPLDGTTNYVHGYPAFAVSIGILIDGVPSVGVVAEMPTIQLYTAIRGKGAFLEGQPIHVSQVKHLVDSLLVTGFGYIHENNWNTNMAIFKQMTDQTQGVRRLGAAAVDICHVACGKVDAYWEFDIHPWDAAAGIVIAQEAGARLSRMDGKKHSIYDNQILISNGYLHDTLINEFIPFL